MKKILLIGLFLNLFYNFSIAQSWLSYTTSNSGIASDSINCMIVASNQKIWIGHPKSGISVFDGTNWMKYNKSNGLIDDSVYSIFEDINHNIWVGQATGVSKFDGSTWTTEGKTGFKNVADIIQDSAGRIWVTSANTDTVLAIYFSSNIWKYYEKSYFTKPIKKVTSLMLDVSGKYFWIGTDSGVFVFKPYKDSTFNQNYTTLSTNIKKRHVTKSMGYYLQYTTFKDINSNAAYYCSIGTESYESQVHYCTYYPYASYLSLKSYVFYLGFSKPNVYADTILIGTDEQSGSVCKYEALNTPNNKLSLGVNKITTDSNNWIYVSTYNKGLYIKKSLPITYGKVSLANSNDTCNFSVFQKGIKLKINPGNYQVITNRLGYWQIDSLPIGTYTITYDSTNPIFTKYNCPNSSTFTITQFNKNTYAGLITLRIKSNCIDPDIGMSIWPRKCVPNKLYINASNSASATDTIKNAYIDLTIDTILAIDSANATYTYLGNNIYRFSIGNLPPDSSFSLIVHSKISCFSSIGSSLCLQANLGPNSSCATKIIPNYAQNICSLPYDNSSYVILSSCKPDSVKFVVKNIGTGNAVCFSPLNVYSSGTLFKSDSIKLNAGDSAIYTFACSGQTISMLVTNHPGFPGNNSPISHQSNCSTPISSNVVGSFGYSKYNRNYTMFCSTIRNSYDPNDKQVIPTGLTEHHYTLPNKPLQYTIRFQNTGNDTAYKVVVQDTLDPNLNSFTLCKMVSSHKYTFEIKKGGVATWTFDKIMLPDSNKNKITSNGFITFSIEQNPNLLEGTVISNHAQIYFDLNPPIYTNKTINRISNKSNKLNIIYKDTCKTLSRYNYTDTFHLSGYDSFVERHYNYKLDTFNITKNACDSFIFNGVTYFYDTSFKVFRSGKCDSFLIISYKVNKRNFNTTNVVTNTSYSWQGTTYFTSGIYRKTYLNQFGCDSTLELNLKINLPAPINIDTSACDSFRFNNKTYRQTSNFKDTFQNKIYAVNLKIYSSKSDTTKLDTCVKSLIWKGKTYNQSGTFIIQNKSIYGCDSNLVLILKLKNSYNVTASNGKLVSTCMNCDYQWYNCSGSSLTKITNETKKEFIPTISGYYSVIVKDNSNCLDTSKCINQIKLSILSSTSKNAIIVFPNPTQNILHIDLGAQIKNIKVTLSELSGKTISSQVYNKMDKIELDIKKYPAGIYILEITNRDEGTSNIFKVVKEE